MAQAINHHPAHPQAQGQAPREPEAARAPGTHPREGGAEPQEAGGATAPRTAPTESSRKAGHNLHKGAIIPAIDEGIREAGSAMYGGNEGGDGPPSPPPNPLLGVQQAYASYATTANALNPYT